MGLFLSRILRKGGHVHVFGRGRRALPSIRHQARRVGSRLQECSAVAVSP
jgi:hypothetical protein